MITILHTIETGGPGGAETVFRNLVCNLDASFRSIVVVPEDRWLNRELKLRGIRTIVVDGAEGRPTGRLRKLIKSECVDIIHSHLPDQNTFSVIAARLSGASCVATYHGALSDRLKCKLKFRLVAGLADRLVAVSDDLATQLAAAGCSEKKIRRIYNGVDIPPLSPPSAPGLRQELKLSPDVRLIGMLANFREAKAYPDFVEAAKIVCREVANAYFISAGEFDGTISRQVREQIAAAGLQDRVFLLGFREDSFEIMHQLDVFVLSSIKEGFSLATVEAMAAGTVPIVTRCGGPEEIVTNGKTGIIVEPKSPSQLAAGIVAVLNDRELAANLGHNAKADVESRFSVSNMVQQYQALYEEVLGVKQV